MTPKTLVIGSDHAATNLKAVLLALAQEQGWQVLDYGTHDQTSVDYPDIAHRVCAALPDKASLGVLLCGSGIGMSIAANRHPHIRAALCHNTTTARLCREHNDANVLVLGARLIGEELAKECLLTFLQTPFAGGRHATRIQKLNPCY